MQMFDMLHHPTKSIYRRRLRFEIDSWHTGESLHNSFIPLGKSEAGVQYRTNGTELILIELLQDTANTSAMQLKVKLLLRNAAMLSMVK